MTSQNKPNEDIIDEIEGWIKENNVKNSSYNFMTQNDDLVNVSVTIANKSISIFCPFNYPHPNVNPFIDPTCENILPQCIQINKKMFEGNHNKNLTYLLQKIYSAINKKTELQLSSSSSSCTSDSDCEYKPKFYKNMKLIEQLSKPQIHKHLKTKKINHKRFL